MFMGGNSHESFDVMFARLTKRCMKLLLPLSWGLIEGSFTLYLMRLQTFMNVFKFSHSMHQVNNKCFRVDCEKKFPSDSEENCKTYFLFVLTLFYTREST